MKARTYVLMTSLALLAGTGIGYFSGKDSAMDQFASDCAHHSLTVVYDYSLREHRGFHCFELEPTNSAKSTDAALPRDALVL